MRDMKNEQVFLWLYHNGEKCLLEKKDFVKEKREAERKIYLYRHNSVNIL